MSNIVFTDKKYGAEYEMLTTYRPGWWSDISSHPASPLVDLYGSGRTQNLTAPVCPFCGEEQHDFWESLHGDSGEMECHACDLELTFESSFGYGYSTKAPHCNNSHVMVVTSQTHYNEKITRITKCVICEHAIYHHLNPQRMPLPWLEEYNDPAYFDPDGILDTGLTQEEQVEDRMHGAGTPVLDFLAEVKRKQRYYGKDSVWGGMERALEQHEREHGEHL